MLNHTLDTLSGSFFFPACTMPQGKPDEKLGPSQIFPEHVQSPKQTYSLTRACGFLDSQEYVRGFQNSPQTTHASGFPFGFAQSLP